MVEKGVQVAAVMDDAKDKYDLVFNTVDDDLFAHRQAAASGAEIVIAGSSDIGEAGKHEKTVGEGVNQTVGNFAAAAFLRNLITNLVKIGFGAGC